MGVDFRGKGYVRFVRLGKRRVKEGEAVAIWNQYGVHKEIVGPRLVRLWWSTIRFLEHHVAESNQYLRIKFRDGTVRHVRGPSTLYENPVYHMSVKVETSISLPDDSSYLVVLSGVDSTRGVDAPKVGDTAESGAADLSGKAAMKRKIVVGPTTFFPEPADRVHQFKWTADGAGALSEENRVLNMRAPIVRTLTCNVRDASEYGASISVEMRATLTSIENVLSVADPIADCDTLVHAAVVQALTGTQFTEKGSSLMSVVRAAVATPGFEEELRKSLHQHAACNLTNFRVVHAKASEVLERLYRKEDELAAAKVTEQLAVISLDAAMERQEREQKLQAAKQEHELALELERETAARKRQELDDQRRLAYFKELKKMSVDLTKYLCTARPDMEEAQSNGAKERRCLQC